MLPCSRIKTGAHSQSRPLTATLRRLVIALIRPILLLILLWTGDIAAQTDTTFSQNAQRSSQAAVPDVGTPGSSSIAPGSSAVDASVHATVSGNLLDTNRDPTLQHLRPSIPNVNLDDPGAAARATDPVPQSQFPQPRSLTWTSFSPDSTPDSNPSPPDASTVAHHDGSPTFNSAPQPPPQPAFELDTSGIAGVALGWPPNLGVFEAFPLAPARNHHLAARPALSPAAFPPECGKLHLSALECKLHLKQQRTTSSGNHPRTQLPHPLAFP